MAEDLGGCEAELDFWWAPWKDPWHFMWWELVRRVSSNEGWLNIEINSLFLGFLNVTMLLSWVKSKRLPFALPSLTFRSASPLENNSTNSMNCFNTKLSAFLRNHSLLTQQISIFSVDTASVPRYFPTLIMSFTLRLPSEVCPFPLKQELDCGEWSTTKSFAFRNTEPQSRGELDPLAMHSVAQQELFRPSVDGRVARCVCLCVCFWVTQTKKLYSTKTAPSHFLYICKVIYSILKPFTFEW